MPEIKRTFQAGKMNRTLDERLIPQGEYVEALNINIGRSDSSDVGAVENVLGNVRIGDTGDYIDNAKCIGSLRDNGNERIYMFVTSNADEFNRNTGSHAVLEYDQLTGAIKTLASGEWLDFHPNNPITGINLVDGLLFWTDDRNEPRKINVSRALEDGSFYNTDDKAAVAKFAPFKAPNVESINTTGTDSTFLEDKLVRFAYRFKFNDGEFSTISPFTPICFTSVNSIASTDLVDGTIPSFVNTAKRILLSVDVPVNYGITGVELLYNESTTSNIYILDELSANTNDDDLLAPDIPIDFVYDSQDPFKTLPGNQLTRVYDAIPRRAKSQEFASGRLIYGNYLQNYNLPNISFAVQARTKDANDADDVFFDFSVKSRRTYQVGVVLADKYGRQSPVILSSTGGDTIYVKAAEDNASALQQLQIKFNTDLPDWAHSYRIVIKQRQQEYHNWFAQGDGTNLPILGNNINKIPRDTTGQGGFNGDTFIAPSNIKLFSKVTNGVTNSNDVISQVASISYAAGSAPVATVSGITAIKDADYVFETVPDESNLDIFYETSTGDLVSNITSEYIDIEFFNCWVILVGSIHIELNRLRAAFNETFFTIGIKAYVVQENFQEQRRFNTLIHSSGLFNSRVGINYVNQFNEAEGGITVSLDPADGSIQKLYAEDTQLLIFQEDKVSRSPIDKDFIYSAEGGAVPVTSSTQYLGTIAPYAGEYGISKDPGSFAVYGTRKYFTDKNRGVVLRLSNDGLTEISNYGMADFFRDALRISNSIVGSFDEYHDLYNLTIVGDNTYTGREDTNVATANEGYFTLSFEEDVQGWNSFKSFEQESGTTLNNRYYTTNGGILWEHNTGEVYNNFYGQQHGSYLECVLNDSPSDVKEFKTINYEGTEGWACERVLTNLDDLRIIPEPEDVRLTTLTLEIDSDSEGVENGVISGTQRLTVLTGSQFKWIIKVSPATPEHTFPSATDVTVIINEGDDDEYTVEGVLNENDGSLYFATNTEVAGVDRTFRAKIEGRAVEDISGSILTIALVHDVRNGSVIDDEVEVFVNSTEFEAGDSSFAYVAGDNNPSVNFGVRLVNPDLYEITNDFLTTSTLSDDILTGDEDVNVNDDKTEITFDRDITLPIVTTAGSITVSETADPLRLRTKINYGVPVFTPADDVLTPYVIINEELIEVDSVTAVLPDDDEFYTSGKNYAIPTIYYVPEFELNDPDDDDDVDTGRYIPDSSAIASNFIAADSNYTINEVLRLHAGDLEFEFNELTLNGVAVPSDFLLGSMQVKLQTLNLEQNPTDRTTTSADVTVLPTANIITYELGDVLITGSVGSETFEGDPDNPLDYGSVDYVKADDENIVFKINTDVSSYYTIIRYSPEQNTDGTDEMLVRTVLDDFPINQTTYDDGEARTFTGTNNLIRPGVDYYIDIPSDSINAANYAVLFYPEHDSDKYRGTVLPRSRLFFTISA